MKTLYAILLMSLLPIFGDAAEKLAVGASIPDVTCNDQDGKAVSLAKEGAKGTLLVYFYPKAKTGGCTKQGCCCATAGRISRRPASASWV